MSLWHADRQNISQASHHMMMSLQTSFSQTFDSCHISSIQKPETETQIQIVAGERLLEGNLEVT